LIQFITRKKRNTRYKPGIPIKIIYILMQKWYGKTPLGKKRAKAAKGEDDDGGGKGKGKKGKGKGKKKK